MKGNLSIRSAGQRQRLLEWSQKVADCRQSGMSVKRWCSENGTTTKTYYSWQKKVFEFMVEQQKLQLAEMRETEIGCFVELPAAPQQCTAHSAGELVASVRIGSASVDLYAGAGADVVRALCTALKSC